MGGCHRLGDLGQHPYAALRGNIGQPALTLSPLRKVQSSIFAFQEVGLGLEIPLKNADKLRSLTEGFAQESEDSHFALQCFEARRIRHKFEDPKLAGLGVLRKPNLTVGGSVERTDEPPVLATGDRIAGLEAQFRRERRRPARFAVCRYRQKVAHAGHSHAGLPLTVSSSRDSSNSRPAKLHRRPEVSETPVSAP